MGVSYNVCDIKWGSAFSPYYSVMRITVKTESGFISSIIRRMSNVDVADSIKNGTYVYWSLECWSPLLGVWHRPTALNLRYYTVCLELEQLKQLQT